MNLNDYLTIFIAILALSVSIWNVIEARRHQQLSVTPKLNLSTKFRGKDGNYGVRIKNCGLGPATIISIRLIFDGKIVKDDHESWLKAFQESGLDLFCWHIQRPYSQETIYTGEYAWILRTDKFDQEANDVIRALNCLQIKVIYESMYKKIQPVFLAKLAEPGLLIEDEKFIGEYLV